MDITQLKQMKDIDKELAQYEKAVANLTSQKTVLKDVIEKSYIAWREM